MPGPTAPTLIQTLTLTIGTSEFQAIMSNAALVPTYSDTSVSTFSGEYVTTAEAHALHVEGFQDYGAVESLCELLWAADLAVPIAFVLDVGGASWTGDVSPRKPNAGGAAGGALDFTIDLPVQGPPVYTAPV